MWPELGIELMESRFGQSNCWVNGIRVKEEEKLNFTAAASAAKIECRAIWTPIHRSVPYSGFMHDGLECTERLSREIVLLP